MADYPKLAGGVGSLATVAPAETVGSYWPYATTLFDFINRAMPFYAPHSLTPDQVYAVTAFLLNLNEIVPDDFVADAKTVPAVKMPNRDGFIWKDPRPLTHDTECMTNCTDPARLRITSNAADVASDAAHHRAARRHEIEITMRERAKRGLAGAIAAVVLLAPLTAAAADPGGLPGDVAAGRALAFDRSMGNCLACHAIAGGDLPGNLGPPLQEREGNGAGPQATLRHHRRRAGAQPADRDAAVRPQRDPDPARRSTRSSTSSTPSESAMTEHHARQPGRVSSAPPPYAGRHDRRRDGRVVRRRHRGGERYRACRRQELSRRGVRAEDRGRRAQGAVRQDRDRLAEDQPRCARHRRERRGGAGRGADRRCRT